MQVFREPGTEDLFLADDQAGFRLGMASAGMGDEAIEHYAARLNTPEAVVGALNWYRGADPADSDGLGPITAETLYVWSTEDIALGRLGADLTGQFVDGPYRFEILEGVTHWIPEEAPDRLAELLLEHLAPGWD
jgi:pimeloyl-ACP methyl ester carboxylesterase